MPSTYIEVDGSTSLKHIQIQSVDSHSDHTILDVVGRRATIRAVRNAVRTVWWREAVVTSGGKARWDQLILTVDGQ